MARSEHVGRRRRDPPGEAGLGLASGLRPRSAARPDAVAPDRFLGAVAPVLEAVADTAIRRADAGKSGIDRRDVPAPMQDPFRLLRARALLIISRTFRFRRHEIAPRIGSRSYRHYSTNPRPARTVTSPFYRPWTVVEKPSIAGGLSKNLLRRKSARQILPGTGDIRTWPRART